MELPKALSDIAGTMPLRLVLSNPSKGANFRRVNISLAGEVYYAEKLTETQAFHERVPPDNLPAYLAELFGAGAGAGFSQLHAFTENHELALRLTKSGKVLQNKRITDKKDAAREHNRQKSYIIKENTAIPILRDMGIFTADGKVVSSMQDKFRQINRFLEIVDDCYKSSVPDPIRVVDFGSGKSYLTFLVYHYFTEIKHVRARIIGLDLKADVVKKCNDAAKKYGYSGLSFEVGDISDYNDFRADLLISLHACDTASDYALLNAVKNNVPVILLAPCCQHEINGQLNPSSLKIFSRYGLLKERVSAALTDAIRARLLTYAGYKTQILEFIDFSHTAKNLLIRAEKTEIPQKVRKEAYDEVIAVCNEFKLEPILLKKIEEIYGNP